MVSFSDLLNIVQILKLYGRRSRGRPATTFIDQLENDTGLSGHDLASVMANKLEWNRHKISTGAPEIDRLSFVTTVSQPFQKSPHLCSSIITCSVCDTFSDCMHDYISLFKPEFL